MPAYARIAAASALAVSLALFALPAAAADLYEPPYEGYGEGPPPPDRYADVPDDFEPPYPPPAYAGRDRCVPREVARDRLRAAGWRGFHAVEPRDDVVLVKARRPIRPHVRSDDRPLLGRGRRRQAHLRLRPAIRRLCRRPPPLLGAARTTEAAQEPPAPWPQLFGVCMMAARELANAWGRDGAGIAR